MASQGSSPSAVFYCRGLSERVPDKEERAEIEKIIDDGEEHTFYVTNTKECAASVKWFNDHFHGLGTKKRSIELRYAVKCQGQRELLKCVLAGGGGVDCASIAEMTKCLEMGFKPDQIVFSNSCKMASHMKFAEAHGIRLTAADSISELQAIKRHYPSAKVMLRMWTATPGGTAGGALDLSKKFGARPGEMAALLSAAKELGTDIVGVSYHGGSNPAKWEEAYLVSTFEAAIGCLEEQIEFGFTPEYLDIGGGQARRFGPKYRELFGKLLEKLPENVRVLAEPGRCLAKPIQTRVVRVMRVRENDVILSDGYFGGMRSQREYHQHYLLPAKRPEARDGSEYSGKMNVVTLYGPTCSSLDWFQKDFPVPASLKPGDWIAWSGMGSYVDKKSSRFNDMPQATGYKM